MPQGREPARFANRFNRLLSNSLYDSSVSIEQRKEYLQRAKQMLTVWEREGKVTEKLQQEIASAQKLLDEDIAKDQAAQKKYYSDMLERIKKGGGKGVELIQEIKRFNGEDIFVCKVHGERLVRDWQAHVRSIELHPELQRNALQDLIDAHMAAEKKAREDAHFKEAFERQKRVHDQMVSGN